MDKVLQGVRVLDFSRVLAGPYCGLILATMGAEVIKIEKPGGENDRWLGPATISGEIISTPLTVALNRKGITLNLRSKAGVELLGQLVKRSDVVLHSFAPGSPQANILKYEALVQVNDRIIVTSVSGFGLSGPYSDRPCFDTAAQALSGGMSISGLPGNIPTKSTIPYVDFGSGLFAALGTVLALYYRQMTGEGQLVDTALLDTAVSFMTAYGAPADYKATGYVRGQFGNAGTYNFAGLFRTKDGWIFINTISNSIWRRFARLLGREDMVDDLKVKDDLTRFKNRHIIEPVVNQWTMSKTTEEAMQLLQEARVPCGKVNNVAEMLDDPQVKARELIMNMEYPNIGEIPVPLPVPKLSKTPGKVETRAPMIGEHNEEVYYGLLGLSPEKLSQLREQGVI